MKECYITHRCDVIVPYGVDVVGVLGGMSREKKYYVGSPMSLPEMVEKLHEKAQVVFIEGETFPAEQVALAFAEMGLKYRDEVLLAAWFFAVRGWRVIIDEELRKSGTWEVIYTHGEFSNSH